MHSKNPITRTFAQLIVATGLILGSTTVFAEDDKGHFFGKEAPGKWIIGLKAAKVDTNVQGVRDADAYGIVAGYEFARVVGSDGGSAAFELEYLVADETQVGSTLLEYEADIVNGFFTYRSAGTVFYKLKGGLSYSDLTTRFGFLEAENSEVAIAAGIGIGVRIQEYGEIELEYSQDTGDNDFGILGLNALLEF